MRRGRVLLPSLLGNLTRTITIQSLLRRAGLGFVYQQDAIRGTSHCDDGDVIFGPWCRLGLEYDFRFRKGVRMGETCRLTWVVSDVSTKPGLGEIVSSEASMTIESTQDIAVSGWGRCVLLDT
jgi:hypothetical protein